MFVTAQTQLMFSDMGEVDVNIQCQVGELFSDSEFSMEKKQMVKKIDTQILNIKLS